MGRCLPSHWPPLGSGTPSQEIPGLRGLNCSPSGRTEKGDWAVGLGLHGRMLGTPSGPLLILGLLRHMSTAPSFVSAPDSSLCWQPVEFLLIAGFSKRSPLQPRETRGWGHVGSRLCFLISTVRALT